LKLNTDSDESRTPVPTDVASRIHQHRGDRPPARTARGPGGDRQSPVHAGDRGGEDQDGVDAAVLAQLLAAGFLPEVWMPDEETAALRRQEFRKVRRPNRMRRTALRAAA